MLTPEGTKDQSTVPEAERDTWMTPTWITEQVAAFLDHDFMDPCADSDDPAHCGATSWYTIETDGLAPDHPWAEKVYINPPYSDITPWVAKLTAELDAGHTRLALLLLPVSPETKWWRALMRLPSAVLVFNRRIKFLGASKQPLFASALVCVAADPQHLHRFGQHFRTWGLHYRVFAGVDGL